MKNKTCHKTCADMPACACKLSSSGLHACHAQYGSLIYKMADSETTDAEFLKWIKSLEIQNDHDVLEILKCDGFYKLKHMKDFRGEEDLRNLPLKKAEARRFLSAVKELEQNNWQLSSTGATKNDDEQPVHITNPPAEVTLAGVKMSEKLRKQFAKENVIFTNPLNDKHVFFNALFPTLFNASYTRLQSRFVNYFKSERKRRWDFKCSISKIEERYDTLVHKPVGQSGGHGLSGYLVVPSKFDKHNIGVVANGIDELQSLNISVQDLRDKLVKDRKE
jgi:hypothetical protein